MSYRGGGGGSQPALQLRMFLQSELIKLTFFCEQMIQWIFEIRLLSPVWPQVSETGQLS